jgi:hypothetical protein
VVSDARLFLELHAIEQVALQALGPLLGSFYNPTSRWVPGRFLVGVGAHEFLALALDRSLTPVRPVSTAAPWAMSA